MNSFLFSFESNDRNTDRVLKGPNQFCLSLFKKGSYDDPNALLDFFDTKDGRQMSQNVSNLFQLHVPSSNNQSPGLELFLSDCKYPTLDQFIKVKSEFKNLKMETKVSPQPIAKLIKRSLPAIRDYKKNICRNLVRHAIKFLSSNQSEMYLNKLLSDEQVKELITYYTQKLEIFSGFRTLKDHILEQLDDDSVVRRRKQIFKQYLIWFFKERAIISILHGEADNLSEYIKYKNEVLLFYLQRPEQWYSNKPLWRVDLKNQNQKKKRVRKGKFMRNSHSHYIKVQQNELSKDFNLKFENL